MITLDEAIERFENNAEFERRNGNLQGCLDFRQLAEWLKDYKKLLEQEPSRDIKEIAEIMKCNADAETKCKMVSNILTAKPHYFEVSQEPTSPCDLCRYDYIDGVCGDCPAMAKAEWER